jgi:hypothetical protein
LTSSQSGAVTLTEASGALTPEVTGGANPLAVNYAINVGQASVGPTAGTFGAALQAAVSSGAHYGNGTSGLASTTTAGPAPDGNSLPVLGTTATFLEGVAASSTTVTQAWRARLSTEGFLHSDVMQVTGLGGNNTAANPYVLQMNYVTPASITDQNAYAALSEIYLAWLNPTTDTWQNAIKGNTPDGNTVLSPFLESFAAYEAGTVSDYDGGTKTAGQFVLGDWGVDTSNGEVWAVLDHQSVFASVPEPGSIAMMVSGGLTLVGFGWYRRRRQPKQSSGKRRHHHHHHHHHRSGQSGSQPGA